MDCGRAVKVTRARGVTGELKGEGGMEEVGGQEEVAGKFAIRSGK